MYNLFYTGQRGNNCLDFSRQLLPRFLRQLLPRDFMRLQFLRHVLLPGMHAYISYHVVEKSWSLGLEKSRGPERPHERVRYVFLGFTLHQRCPWIICFITRMCPDTRVHITGLANLHHFWILMNKIKTNLVVPSLRIVHRGYAIRNRETKLKMYTKTTHGSYL